MNKALLKLAIVVGLIVFICSIPDIITNILR